MMLGRSEVNVIECITAYSELIKAVFVKPSSKLPLSRTKKVNVGFNSRN